MTDMTSTYPIPAEREAAFRAARRHSKFVRRLRRILPVVGILTCLGFFAALWVANSGPGLLLTAAILARNALTMDNPRLTGSADGRTFEVSARRAVQNLSDLTVLALQDIDGRFEIDDINTASISAVNGRFDTNSEVLVLSDSILMRATNGYAATFTEATIDLKAGTLESTKPVALTSPNGTISADRLSAGHGDGVVRFEGNVRMTIVPSAASGEGGQ